MSANKSPGPKIIALLATLLAAPCAQAASFIPLGDLPGGSTQSSATDVSAHGSVVVGWSWSESGIEAFRWTSDAGMVGLGDLAGGDFLSRAYSVSSDGRVVVGESRVMGGNEAFRWAADTGMVGLGDFAGSLHDSNALGISADGNVIVGEGNLRDGGGGTGCSGDGDEAFHWTSGTGMVSLGDGVLDSQATAASADGSVIVGWAGLSSRCSPMAFRWTPDNGMTGLGFLAPGTFSVAESVSADGSVIVGGSANDVGREAFRWTSDTGMKGLGDLPGGPFNSRAFGVSADGSVVVGESLTGSFYEAFVWTRGSGMLRLQDVLAAQGATGLEGWTLWRAFAISDDGRWIAGEGRHPSGHTEAFLAEIAPEVFGDVSSEYWAFQWIWTLANSGISSGCGGDDYCPEEPVTRAQMAVFLERGINGSEFSPPAATGNVFADVATEDFAADFIEQLSADGITGGCGGNNYCPDDPVTRAQMAVFLLKAKHGSGYTPPPTGGDQFGDVDGGHWAVAWIEQLAAESITSGCGNNNYCPDDPVTRAQMAVFLVRTFDLL